MKREFKIKGETHSIASIEYEVYDSGVKLGSGGRGQENQQKLDV
jgi:hypothetical protein